MEVSSKNSTPWKLLISTSVPDTRRSLPRQVQRGHPRNRGKENTVDRAGVSSETVESERGMNSQLNYSVLCDLRKNEFSELRDVLLWPRGGDLVQFIESI